MTPKIRALVLALAVCALMILVGGVATAYPGSSGMGSGMMWGSTNTSSTQGATPPAPSPGWCWDNDSYRWVPPTTTTGTGSPSTPPTERAAHFSDIPMGCWYDAAVTDLSGRGVIGGFADGTFRGDLPISRAQFAAMLGRMLGVQPGGRAQFSDVTGNWAEGWIAVLAQGGIMQGYPDGTFGPDRQITRAQCAAFVARALGLSDDWTDTVQFPDLSGTWACGYVHQLWRQGIVSGYGNGMFGPDDQISRAQAAAMLWRCGNPSGWGTFASLGERIFVSGTDENGQPIPRSGGMGMMSIGRSCAQCHGADGKGRTLAMMMGGFSTPDITWTHLSSDGFDPAAFARAVRDGVDDEGATLRFPMPRWGLSDAQVDALIAYLRTL